MHGYGYIGFVVRLLFYVVVLMGLGNACLGNIGLLIGFVCMHCYI